MLLALFVRVAVPIGFMPKSTGGTVSVQLCDGQHSITLDLGEKNPTHNKAGDAPCMFAGGFAAGLITHATPVPALSIFQNEMRSASTAIADLTTHRLAAPPPPAHGPPARA